MSVGEVLDLRKSGSGLYIDPSAPDCLEGSTMLAATTSSELYPKGIFYLYDHLGNTRVTFHASGTSCVNVTNYSIRYLADYYPYGKLLRSWQSSSQEKYLTTQHERDLATGLDFRNARYYDSETMRFYGVDNLSDDPNQVDKSPFVYTWGNPVNLTDPDGNCPWCVGAIVGAVVDYGFQVSANALQGKGWSSFTSNIDYTSIMISAVAGGLSGGMSAINNSNHMVRASKLLSTGVDAGESIAKQLHDKGSVDLTKLATDVIASKVAGGIKVKGLEDTKPLVESVNREQRKAATSPRNLPGVKDARDKLIEANTRNLLKEMPIQKTGENSMQTLVDKSRSSSGSSSQSQSTMPRDNTTQNQVFRVTPQKLGPYKEIKP